MAHLLTDEAFALSIGHFRRLGRADERATGSPPSAARSSRGTWRRSAGSSSAARSRTGAVRHRHHLPGRDDRPRVGLITARRELVAALVGAGVGVVVALLTSPSIGIVAGGLVGPLVGLLVPAARARRRRRSARRRRRTATRCPGPTSPTAADHVADDAPTGATRHEHATSSCWPS